MSGECVSSENTHSVPAQWVLLLPHSRVGCGLQVRGAGYGVQYRVWDADVGRGMGHGMRAGCGCGV